VQDGELTDPNGASSAGVRAPSPFHSSPPPAAAESGVICRFLALEGPDGLLVPAGGAVDPNHRCVALRDAVPQSARQQQLVCLTAGHTTCPRYLRGIIGPGGPPPAEKEPVSTAIIVAAMVFLAAIAASFAFLGVRGGFAFAGTSSGNPSQVAVAPSISASVGASASNLAVASASLSALGSTSPSPSPSSTAAPSATPAATPAPTPTATVLPTRTPTPTSDRFAVLTKCPSTPDCWIYVIRSGDNLYSIAHWFGVDYNRMRAMNPNLQVPIRAGDTLRIPTPTR
jgi:LysM domain-containing protein